MSGSTFREMVIRRDWIVSKAGTVLFVFSPPSVGDSIYRFTTVRSNDVFPGVELVASYRAAVTSPMKLLILVTTIFATVVLTTTTLVLSLLR